jgi:hypothetical protein
MGAPAQANSPTQVYYDPETQEYFSYKPTENRSKNLMFSLLSGNGIVANGQQTPQERIYLSSPYAKNVDRFIPKTITPQYPEMNMLFPALNAGLAQGIISSTQPDGAMSGAGRFLAPQTTNTQGK